MNKKYIVALDGGHGGHDSGAVGNGLKEKDINLSVTLRLGEILKKYNIDVIYSRTTDIFVGLTERANIANRAKADIFVSIHVNSATNKTTTGFEIFTSKGQTKADILATEIGQQLQKDFPSSLFRKDVSDGDLDKEANFTVLVNTKMPAVLIELGFISNSKDAMFLKNKQPEMARSIAKGILKNLGIKYIENNTELLISSKAKATIEQVKQLQPVTVDEKSEYEKAVQELVLAGIIASPAVWNSLEKVHLNNVKSLIIKMANYITQG